MEELQPLNQLMVDIEETSARAWQNPQFRSPKRWNRRLYSLLKAPTTAISGLISGAAKNTEIDGSVLNNRTDEPDRSIKNGESESLLPKGLLNPGVPDKNRFQLVQQSIAQNADRLKVLDPSSAFLGSSNSKEVIFKDPTDNNTFNSSPIPSKNIDINQDNILDTAASIRSVLAKTPNKLRIRSYPIRDSPAKKLPSDPAEEPIPHYTLVRPSEIFEERVEQTDIDKPEKTIAINAKQYSIPPNGLLNEFFKQTGASPQEDHNRDNEKHHPVLLDEAIAVKSPASESEEPFLNSGNLSAVVTHSVPQDELVPKVELTKSPKEGVKSVVKEDKIELARAERAAIDEAPEVSDGSSTRETEVSDKREDSTSVGSELSPYEPGFQQHISGENQPVAAVSLTLSDHSKDLSIDSFDEALENSWIGEATKPSETGDKVLPRNTLPVHNTARNHPSVQPKVDMLSEPLLPPMNKSRAVSSPLPIISDYRSPGNQDISKPPITPWREQHKHLEGDIQPYPGRERMSETPEQPFHSKIKLVPEGDASTVHIETESKSSEKANVQREKITEKAHALNRRIDDSRTHFDTITSPKPAVPEVGLQKTPSITAPSRSFSAQRSKMGRARKEKAHRDASLNSLSNHDSRIAVYQLSLANQSPVIQMSAAAPETVNKVKVTVRRIEVRPGNSDEPKEPPRAVPVFPSTLSLEEYLRLRGEGKL